MGKAVYRHGLIRGVQRIVLHGMHHVAPAEFFRRVQNDMDTHLAAGYKIFVERLPPPPDRFTIPQGAFPIYLFFQRIGNLYPHRAAGQNQTFEANEMKYPADVVCADISVPEFVTGLYNRGFRVPQAILDLIEDPEYQTVLEDPSREFEREQYEQRIQALGMLDLLRSDLYTSIAIDYRNEAAVKVIENYMLEHPAGKAWVHYGNAHLQGIAELLEKNGWVWVLTELIEIEP